MRGSSASIGSAPSVARNVDARAKLFAAACIAVVATLAPSAVGSALLAAIVLACVAAIPESHTAARAASKGLLVALAAIVVVQGLLAPHISVRIVHGVSIESGWLRGAIRDLQLLTLVWCSVVFTTTTAPLDAARAISFYLRPLAWLRVPIDDMAIVLATALGIVPHILDELAGLRIAQKARGIDRKRLSLTRRVKLDLALVSPLAVGAFRRARTLAEALHVRGFVRGAPRTRYRPQRFGARELTLVLLAVAAAVAAWVL